MHVSATSKAERIAQLIDMDSREDELRKNITDAKARLNQLREEIGPLTIRVNICGGLGRTRG